MDNNNLELASSFIEYHVDAAARELETQPAESAAALILAIPLTQARRLITQMVPVYAARILNVLTLEEAASVLSRSSANQIATILRHLPIRPRVGLLRLLPERLAKKSRRLLTHSGDSVGAWMSVDIVMLPENITAADALHRIRESSNLGDGDAIQVLSDSQQPVGYVSVADLLRAGNDVLVSSLCHEVDPLEISSRTSLRAAQNHPGWHKQDNLIVVDSRGQVEGILRYYDLCKGLQISPSNPLPVVDDSLLSGFSQAYLSTLWSLFSLINEPYSTAVGMAKSNQESRQ